MISLSRQWFGSKSFLAACYLCYYSMQLPMLCTSVFVFCTWSCHTLLMFILTSHPYIFNHQLITPRPHPFKTQPKLLLPKPPPSTPKLPPLNPHPLTCMQVLRVYEVCAYPKLFVRIASPGWSALQSHQLSSTPSLLGLLPSWKACAGCFTRRVSYSECCASIGCV